MITATTFVQGIRKRTVALNELLIMITDKSWPMKNYLSYSQPGLCEKCPYSDRIFQPLDRIWGDTLYLSAFSPNAKKYGPEKLQIWTLFTQCGVSDEECQYQKLDQIE